MFPQPLDVAAARQRCMAYRRRILEISQQVQALHAAGANTTDERKLSMVTTYYGVDNAPLAGTRSARLDPVRIREA